MPTPNLHYDTWKALTGEGNWPFGSQIMKHINGEWGKGNWVGCYRDDAFYRGSEIGCTSGANPPWTL